MKRMLLGLVSALLLTGAALADGVTDCKPPAGWYFFHIGVVAGANGFVQWTGRENGCFFLTADAADAMVVTSATAADHWLVAYLDGQGFYSVIGAYPY